MTFRLSQERGALFPAEGMSVGAWGGSSPTESPGTHRAATLAWPRGPEPGSRMDTMGLSKATVVARSLHPSMLGATTFAARAWECGPSCSLVALRPL